MKLTPVIHYQGLCHTCQQGYYYPGGDCQAGPDDKRELACASPKHAFGRGRGQGRGGGVAVSTPPNP